MTKPKQPLRFEYWKSVKNKQWYWRLKAGNNEPICQSEGYKSKGGVLKAYHAIFDFDTVPVAVDINAEAVAKFTGKKPKHYEGKLNRSFP